MTLLLACLLLKWIFLYSSPIEIGLVSVVVPIYNMEKYLGQCLESIENQTYQNIEIICVNDGSTDSSLNMLNEYAKKDKRIVVIDQENRKTSAARNRGFNASKGEYVLFVDSDDFVDFHLVEKVYAAAKNNQTNADIVYFGASRYNNSATNESKKNVSYDSMPHNIYVNDSLKLWFAPRKWRYFAIWNKMYKTELLQKNQIFFEEEVSLYYEDVIFNLKAFAYANVSVTIPDVLYYWRKDNENLSATKRVNDSRYAKEIQFVEGLKKVLDRWITIEHTKKYKTNLLDYVFQKRITLANMKEKEKKEVAEGTMDKFLSHKYFDIVDPESLKLKNRTVKYIKRVEKYSGAKWEHEGIRCMGI